MKNIIIFFATPTLSCVQVVESLELDNFILISLLPFNLIQYIPSSISPHFVAKMSAHESPGNFWVPYPSPKYCIKYVQRIHCSEK